MKGIVVSDYLPKTGLELSLKVDDVIEEVEIIDETWCAGSFEENRGIFPTKCVKIFEDDLKDPSVSPEETSEKSYEGSKGKVLLEYAPKTKVELQLKVGDIIHQVEKIDDIWCSGHLHGNMGIFPGKCIEILKSVATKTSQTETVMKAKVLFEYKAKEDDELTLKKGDIITEVASDSEDDEWCIGILEGKWGLFPKCYVKVFQELRPRRPPTPPRKRQKKGTSPGIQKANDVSTYTKKPTDSLATAAISTKTKTPDHSISKNNQDKKGDKILQSLKEAKESIQSLSSDVSNDGGDDTNSTKRNVIAHNYATKQGEIQSSDTDCRSNILVNQPLRSKASDANNEKSSTSSSDAASESNESQLPNLYVIGNLVTGNSSVQKSDQNTASSISVSVQSSNTLTDKALLQNVINSINEDSFNRTLTKVTEGFGTANIVEPKSMFHPQITEVPDFYKGIYVDKAKVETQNADESLDYITGNDDDSSSDESSPDQEKLDTSLLDKVKTIFQSKNKKALQTKKLEGVDKKKDKVKRIERRALEVEAQRKRFEYIKERLFDFKEKLSRKSSSFESMLELISQSNSESGILAIVAQAGAGKTTIMKQAAREIMERNGISPKTNFQSAKESRFDLVIYREFKSIPDPAKPISLRELLFKGYCKDENEEKIIYDWVIKNQSKVALFFDGLDQAPWRITDQDCNNYSGQFQEANTPTLISNLLAQKALPKARITISSREFKAAALPNYARPKKVLTLLGFNEIQAEMLFNELVSSTTNTNCQQKAGETGTGSPMDDATDSKQLGSDKQHNFEENEPEFQSVASTTDSNPWQRLNTSSPLLTRFLTIPVFLVFAAIIFTSTTDPLPSTVTGLLAQILMLLNSSEFSRQSENLQELLKKLKHLAYDGMVNGFVLFNQDDLKKHDLKLDEVSDLLLGVPKSKKLNQRLFKSDFFLFFCHQSIQEFLAACFITEMSLKDFKSFVKNRLHQSPWSVVRRFVFGTIYNLNDEYLVSIKKREEKKKILRDSLTPEVINVKGHELLEIFQTLYESHRDELVTTLMQNIELGGTPLGVNEMKLLAYIIPRCSMIENIKLYSCGLNDEVKDAFSYNMTGVKIQVEWVDLEFNDLSFSTLNCFLGNLDVDSLTFRDGEVSGEGGLNWENVTQVKVKMHIGRSLNLKNDKDDDQVQISAEGVELGFYNKDDELLIFKIPPIVDFGINIHYITLAERYLNPKSVESNVDTGLRLQYLEYDSVGKMMKWTGNLKMPKVLLNCRDANDISPLDVQSFMERYQVHVLDVAFWMQESNAAFTTNSESASIKTHVCHRIKGYAEIHELTSYLKKYKSENARVYLLYEPYFEDIMMLINCSSLQTLTLIAHSSHLRNLDQQNLHETAKSSSLQLEVISIDDKPRMNGWEYMDWKAMLGN